MFLFSKLEKIKKVGLNQGFRLEWKFKGYLFTSDLKTFKKVVIFDLDKNNNGYKIMHSIFIIETFLQHSEHCNTFQQS